MALKFNIDAPPFVPSASASGGFQPVKSKKHHTKPQKYRSKNGELWAPPKGWLPFYRCQACHEVMSKKEAPKFPQKINTCGHITCAKCIVTSYLVELNPLCPVEGCGKCVNPKQKEAIPALEILSAPIMTIETESLLSSVTPPISVTPPPKTEVVRETCAFCEKNTGCHCNDEIYTGCPCYDRLCPGDCGTLWCGCIDVCRNRCGLRDDEFRWRW